MANLMFPLRPPEPSLLPLWIDTVFRNPRYGTWTPTITFATPGDLSVVYSLRDGRYYVFGMMKLVVFNIVTSTFTHTTASGNLQITGNPFTAINLGVGGTFFVGMGNFSSWRGITKANYTQVVPRIAENTTIMSADASGSAQTPATIATGDMPTGGTVVFRGFVFFPAFD